MKTYSGEYNLGREVRAQLSQPHRSQTCRVCRSSRERFCPTQKINKMIEKRSGGSVLGDTVGKTSVKSFIISSFKLSSDSSESFIQL